jgi:lipid II:glycine glycyltransferase (peptidoglycan interpeptide bridge formation enzyme)
VTGDPARVAEPGPVPNQPGQAPDEPAERAGPGAGAPAPPSESRVAAEPTPTSAPPSVRLATAEDLEAWDARAVASKTGHVYQSRAWGEYRSAHGWRTWNLVFDDGFPLLVVARDRPVVGGGSAYASRGPIPDLDVELTARRAAAAADLLAGDGVDSLTVDGETPAAEGLTAQLKAAGFEPAEEVQPSRHRMDVHLGPDDSPNSDESTIFASFGATTRNLIRQADRHGLRVLRLDVGGGRAEGEYAGPPLEGFEPLDPDDAGAVEQRLKGFYGMLDATAERRGFALASEEAFLDWSRRSLAAGHSFYLEAVHDEDGPVAGATFLRHGDRITYSLAGDRAELRRKYPGAVRLLVWRGIQVALDERRTTVDLGGIDTPGARVKPNKGDPTYGMYQFKESFGARWVELTGAHQRTMRPLRSLAGRVAGRLAALRR